MIKGDHPVNTKRVGVCAYYKQYLPLTRRIDICKLYECIVTEIAVNNQICFITYLYRSPSQNQKVFQSFNGNLIDVLSGIFKQQKTCSILVDDFNAKLSKQCPSDKDTTTGQAVDTFTTTSSYTQMIDLLMHLIDDKLSCTDMLFTTSSKLLSELDLEPTVYDKCHHVIIVSLNLNIPMQVGRFILSPYEENTEKFHCKVNINI